MKKNRILSALLCLSLAAGLVIPGLPAYAEGEGESGSNSGMKLNKTAVANKNGTYTITLEAYATGQKVISQVNKDVPTDIVLVLDQSGSMDDPIGEAKFNPYSKNQSKNSQHYERRHNGGEGNLYYYDKNTGAYYSVSVVKTQPPKKLDSLKNYTESWGQVTDQCYWYYSNDNLYEKVGEEYKPVKLERTWVSTGFLSGYYRYTYEFSDGTKITSDRNGTTPDLGSHAPLYTMTLDENQNKYTYTYVDADGNTQTIGTSTGADTRFETTLYQRYIDTNAGDKRIDALKSAVTTFTNSVANKAKGADGQLGTPDDIDHRIAVVGFACSNTGDSGYNNYQNTEVFIGTNQYKYGTAARGQYKNALQSMKTTQGQDNINASIGALTAYGATYVNHGVEMANGILNANPVQAGEQRNRVVVVFTDGVPGYSGYDSEVAESAITQANTTRTLGATVYAVGIFSGADASSAGNSDGNETQKANWFMQNLSNNKGTPRTPSYYLSAADAATLNNIFQQIADNIESGGSSTTLDSSAVIKDIISPQFTLPAGATVDDITLETYSYTGENQWTKNNDAMGAKPTVNGDQVSVTGFDFAKNWCGTEKNNGTTTYRGNKLVISFNVEVKDGFLGGNNVYTNTSAGVYENADAAKPVLEFNRPQVNVPIDSVTVTAADKDVYLLSDVELDALKNGATVKVGGVPLKLTANNYGLESWQNEYVDITVQITNKDGNPISDKLENLTEDTTYTVKVTVEPKTVGTSTTEKGDAATAKTGANNPAANINVFKPELTFKDSSAYYGETVPTNNNYSRNQVGTEKWMHAGTEAVPSEMLGEKPTLDISFTPDESKLEGGKYTKQDVPVTATVKIGTENVNEHTTFVHQDCTTSCGWETPTTPGAPAFLIHIKTCTLNITKQGADGDKNEGFIFNVKGPENFRVSVKDNGTVKITGLPLGEYTVTEDEGWSWRYKAENSGKVELTETAYEGSVTIKNAKDKSYLLDGSAYAQNNSVRLAAGN